MAINTAPSVTEKDTKLLIKSLNALTEKFSQSSPEGGRTFSNTAPTRKPIDSDKRAKEAEKIMRNAIKPTIGPFAKIMGRFVESAFGRAMIHWVGTTKSYFSNFASQASSLMNKAFGQFLDDLQPIIQTLKTSVNFLYDVILKPIAKLFSGVAKWGWSKITGAFDAIKDKFTIKKKPEEIVAKAVVKQVDYLKRIDLNTRRIERNTRKEGSAYRRAHLGALLMGMGNRKAPTTNTSGSSIIGSTAGGIGSIVGGVVGGIFSGIGKIFGGIGDLFGSIPFIGGILKMAIPLVLGAGLLKGGWELFEKYFPEQADWVDKNITKPLVAWFKGPFLDTMIDIAETVGGAIVDSIKRHYMGGPEGDIAKILKQQAKEFMDNADKAKTPGEKAKWTAKAKNAKEQADRFEKADKDRADRNFSWTWQGAMYGAAGGAGAGTALLPGWGTLGGIIVGGVLGGLGGYNISNKIGDYSSPLNPEKNEIPILKEGDKQFGGVGTGFRTDILDTVDGWVIKRIDQLDNWVTKNTAPSLTKNSIKPTTIPFPFAQTPDKPNLGAAPEGTWEALVDYFGPEAEQAAKVMMAESTGRAWVTQKNTKAKGKLKNTIDWGLFQINDQHKDALINAHIIQKDMSELLDPVKNIQAAQFLRNRRGDWGDWNASKWRWNSPLLSGLDGTKGGNTAPTIAEKVGEKLQNLAEYVAESAGLTPEEMQTLFNPTPRSSVAAAERERAQNQMYLKGEYKSEEKKGAPAFINNNVDNSSSRSGYSESPKIFDSVFPSFEWVLVNN